MTDARLPDDRLPVRPPDPDARERVVAVLTRLYADDRITSEDLEARLERVYHAGSAAQLAAVTADLPVPLADAGQPGVPAVAGDVRRISALFSGQEQRLTGPVPQQLQVRSRLGYVELDLTRAAFEPGVTEIDVRALLGYVQIRLPPGVRVECLGHAVFGFFSLKGIKRAGDETAPVVVRITGRAAFGFAECFVARDKALPAGRDRR